MRKDVADLFAAEGENTKVVLAELKSRASDALDLALREAPEGSTREKWRYAKKHIVPLLLEFEDEGERNAAASDAAKVLGLKASDLQRVAKPEKESAEKQDNGPAKLELSSPELWPDAVDGSELLDGITNTTRRFVSAMDGVVEAISLWSLYTYVFNAFEVSPLLAITSPEKRCGKTTLLMLVSKFVLRGLSAANITASSLFRAVEKYQPTLLIDEADTFLAGNEELRGIVNSGHRREMAYVIRNVGDDHEPRLFSTWSPKAIALIGAMPDTLEDRAILIPMQRQRAGEKIEELRLDRLPELESIRQRCARWAADNFDKLKTGDPIIPTEITNARARDNWRVLLAIADAAGGRWPVRAREVALIFSSAEPDTESIRVLLLHDLKALFDERGEHLESEKIVAALIEIEGRPWAEGKNGKPLSKTGLARLLRPFKIHPGKWRDGENTARGYIRSDFDEVFARYLDIETPQTPHATESTTYSQNETPHIAQPVAFENSANSNGVNAVASVAFQYMGNGKKNTPEGFEWTEIEGVPLLVRSNGNHRNTSGDEIEEETPEERAEREAILDYYRSSEVADERLVVSGVPQGGQPLDESLFEV